MIDDMRWDIFRLMLFVIEQKLCLPLRSYILKFESPNISLMNFPIDKSTSMSVNSYNYIIINC